MKYEMNPVNECSAKLLSICDKIINEPIPKPMLEVTKDLVEALSIMTGYFEALVEMIATQQIELNQLKAQAKFQLEK